MPGLNQLREQLLSDNRITRAEVRIIQDHIRQDGQLDLEDVKFLVNLRCDAREVCDEFEDLFFPALKKVLLRDGQIGYDEQFYLLKLIYADGKISQREIQFLEQLREEAEEVCPEFQSLRESVLADARLNPT